MLKEHGHPLAKTTIQRLFKDGSEDGDSFSYKSTLKPIAELVLDNHKNNDILRLNDKIDYLIDKIDTVCEMIIEDRKLVHSQINIKDARMERKDAWIEQLMAENKRLDEDIRKLLEKCQNCTRG